MKPVSVRSPRNVLLLWTDQQRPDTIGAYGNAQIRTPNVDRLAAGSVLFEQAYCTQPVCSPSRASILTGLYPHTHGVTSNALPLAADVPTLAELVRPSGYACGYIGKWHRTHRTHRARRTLAARRGGGQRRARAATGGLIARVDSVVPAGAGAG